MVIDSKVSDRLVDAGFKKDPCQFPGERINFIREGTVANNCTYDNAHNIELHRRYNGSGENSFGGAKDWPALSLHVAFQVGQENLRERLAIELAQTVDKFMRKIQKPKATKTVRRKRG